MAIRSPDGTIYTTSGSIQQFNPNDQTHDLFNLYDQELIALGGSPIFYYELFIGSQTIDKLYIESRGKLWSQHPVELTAVYEPIPSQAAMGLFGLDSPDDSVIFYLNYKSFLEKVGHPPVIGSRIFTPHRREHWEITNRKTSGFQRFGEIRLEIYTKRFQESLTTGEGRVSQGGNETGFTLN